MNKTINFIKMQPPIKGKYYIPKVQNLLNLQAVGHVRKDLLHHLIRMIADVILRSWICREKLVVDF